MLHDPRVDAYIAKAAPFAQPLLEHVRDIVHRTCPDTVEAIKWGMPMFLHRDKIIANMAAFKQHASFGTWRRNAGEGSDKPDGMGQFGKLATLADLPSDEALAEAVRQAMAMVEAGGSLRAPAKPKPAAEAPDDLRAALDAVPAAAAAFAAFPPGAQREYVDWVVEAKQPITRTRRIALTVEQCAEGKRRNWKYENC
jgi:uncharacterized protein YdeI (YjbR/CyaY-like superfamily)